MGKNLHKVEICARNERNEGRTAGYEGYLVAFFLSPHIAGYFFGSQIKLGMGTRHLYFRCNLGFRHMVSYLCAFCPPAS